MTECPSCGSTDIEWNDFGGGDAVCVSCGTVCEESTIVSSIEFSESGGGAAQVVGQFVSDNCTKPYSSGIHASARSRYGFMRSSRDTTLANGRRSISEVASQLRLQNHFVDMAHRLFQIAVQRNFVQGRKTMHVVAVCLYIVCRKEKSPHLLIDFSDSLSINVFTLGSCFLKFCRILNIEEQIPLIDPSLFIHRFASRMDLGGKTQVVAQVALRLLANMKRDWIQTGRRPAGLCAAALLIAARSNGFPRTQAEMERVFRVCGMTIRSRMEEFEVTSAAQLTTHQLKASDDSAKGLVQLSPEEQMEMLQKMPDDQRQAVLAAVPQYQTEAALERLKGTLSDEAWAQYSSEMLGNPLDPPAFYRDRMVEVDVPLQLTDQPHAPDPPGPLATDAQQLALVNVPADGGEPPPETVRAMVPVHSRKPKRSHSQAFHRRERERQALYEDIEGSLEQEEGQRTAAVKNTVTTPSTTTTTTTTTPAQGTAVAPTVQPSAAEATSVADVDGSGLSEEENFSDLDDEEALGYVLSHEESSKKAAIWAEMNKPYLEEKALKDKRKRESDKASGNSGGGGVGGGVGAGNAADGRKNKKKRAGPKSGTGQATAEEALEETLVAKRISKKINYEALAGMFSSDQPETHVTESFSTSGMRRRPTAGHGSTGQISAGKRSRSQVDGRRKARKTPISKGPTSARSGPVAAAAAAAAVATAETGSQALAEALYRAELTRRAASTEATESTLEEVTEEHHATQLGARTFAPHPTVAAGAVSTAQSPNGAALVDVGEDLEEEEDEYGESTAVYEEDGTYDEEY